MIFCPAEMAEMAEIFPLFRYFSVSSVIDKDNSHGDWREDIFYNGRNGNYRNRRTSENKVILVWTLSSEEEEGEANNGKFLPFLQFGVP